MNVRIAFGYVALGNLCCWVAERMNLGATGLFRTAGRLADKAEAWRRAGLKPPA